MTKAINVLSLFDGMSAGRLALERAGIPINQYFSSEIDKYAMTVANKNFPDTIQMGDVTKWKEWDLDWNSIDLLLAGFPCQPWSFSGKQKGLSDERGKLSETLLELKEYLQGVNPNLLFLFENVVMKKDSEKMLSSWFGVEPIKINSSLVSAQNRNRLYWCNWEVTQPEDKGIFLKDIVEEGVVDRDKSFCIDANYWKGGNLTQYFEKHRRQLVFHPVLQTRENGRRLTPDGTKRDDNNGIIVRGYEVRPDGKSCTLTTVSKDTYITEDYIIRKLTPTECERLQTFPDGFSEGVSNSQRYKMLGNGWTVDVIVHILSQSPLMEI